jgi:hypothetical protein
MKSSHIMKSSLSSVSQAFFAWADHALSNEIPTSTVAFHFNLYEGTDSVHVQLMGTDSFTPGKEQKDYWPGAETFSTGEEAFEIPFTVAGSNWREWLKTSKEILLAYIENGSKSNVLKRTKGVSAGFVDGDMYVLWQPSASQETPSQVVDR